MSLRYLPPARSPIGVRAIVAGVLALVRRTVSQEHLCERLRQRHAARDVVLTDSGTSALRLAIQAACGPGGSAALPAWGCYDLATAAVGAGALVQPYDLIPETLSPEPASLQDATAGTRALVVAHFFGLPVDLTNALSVAQRAGAFLIEDAAQADGLVFPGGRAAGSFGDFSVVSFGRGKGRTGGGGGALLIRTDRAWDAWNRLAWVGGRAPNGWGDLARLCGQWLAQSPGVYGLPARVPFLNLGETIYHAPWSPRPVSSAAVAAVEANWERSDTEVGLRRKWAGDLRDVLAGTPGLKVPGPVVPAEPGYLRLPILVGDPAVTAVHAGRLRQLGVVRSYPRLLAELPALAPRVHQRQSWPGASRLADSLFTVPTHGALRPQDLGRIARSLGRPS